MSRDKNPNMGRLVYGACQTEFGYRLFTHSNQDHWKSFYPNDEELLPPNIPKSRVWMKIILVIWQLGGLEQAYFFI